MFAVVVPGSNSLKVVLVTKRSDERVATAEQLSPVTHELSLVDLDYKGLQPGMAAQPIGPMNLVLIRAHDAGVHGVQHSRNKVACQILQLFFLHTIRCTAAVNESQEFVDAPLSNLSLCRSCSMQFFVFILRSVHLGATQTRCLNPLIHCEGA
jgi:hypothetical protein